jgi:undecaprenyl-diphosphatase
MSVLVTAILLFAFGLLAEFAGGKPSAFDHNIMRALRNPSDPSAPIGPAWLREVARDVTALGSTIVLGTMTFGVGGYLLLAHEPVAACLIIIAVLGGLALNNLLKLAFARPRPTFIAYTTRHYTKSFPSGHAALSAIIYLTMASLLAQTHPAFTPSLFFISFGIFLTLFIGISRVYLGVHYATDILAGWCVGAAWALSCWLVKAWLQAPT